MPRLAPVNPDAASGKAKDLLGAVKAKLGKVPNMMATMAHSPAVLDAYLSFSGALNGASLPARTREAIAIAVAESNGCNYCLSAHTLLGKGAGLSEADITAARSASNPEPRLNAILRFARAVNDARGFATDDDLRAARSAGITDPEIVEIVATVALNVFTNYINHVTDPVIDFPRVTSANARIPAHA